LILEAYDDEGHWEMRYVAQMQSPSFDLASFENLMQKRVDGYPAYAAMLKKTLQRLEAAFGGSSGSNCVGCQSTPSLKLFSWEKIN
jgi:hypothetical protein